MTAPPVADARPARTRTRAGRRVSASLVAGIVLVGLAVVMMLVSFVHTPYGSNAIDPTAPLRPASTAGHLLGTDNLGRDVFSRLLFGSRVTLFVGIVAVAIAAVVGVPLGILAGMAPRWAYEILMRGNDVLYAFPALLLAVVFAAAFTPSVGTAMAAVGIATIPVFLRVACAGTLQVMSRDYVLAAKAGNCSPGSIAVRHVLPNIAPVVLVQSSVAFGIAILAEAALSYLGLSTNPLTPTWGRMLQESQSYLFASPGLALWPGLAIALSVLGFNLLGDGLRDLFDPRLRDVRP